MGNKNHRTFSFLSCVSWAERIIYPPNTPPFSFGVISCVSWAEKIYLPTKHTKRRENFKDEDRLVHLPSAEGAHIQSAGLRRGRRELTKKRMGNKISEPFRFFRVFRGQKKFYLPTKHTKRRENFKDEDRLVHVPSAEGAHIPISDNGQSSRADPIAAAGREIIQDLRPVLVD